MFAEACFSRRRVVGVLILLLPLTLCFVCDAGFASSSPYSRNLRLGITQQGVVAKARARAGWSPIAICAPPFLPASWFSYCTTPTILRLSLRSRRWGVVVVRLTVVRGSSSTGAYHGAVRPALQPALGQGKRVWFFLSRLWPPLGEPVQHLLLCLILL